MNEPEHEGFVYQVIVEGTLVIVLADQEDATQYVEDAFKSAASVILPVPIFKYRRGKTQ